MARLAIVFIMDDVDDDKEPEEIMHNFRFHNPGKIFEDSSCFFAYKFKSLKQIVRLVPQKKCYI